MDIEKKNQIVQQSGVYFDNGFHCAEAIAASVLEGLGKDAAIAVMHATPFGGGFGRTFDEACGALSGCLIVVGHLWGRQQPGDSWDNAAGLAAGLRQRFLDSYGTTCCRTLRDRFGKEKQMEECGRIVKQMAADLVDLLQKKISH